MAVRVQYPAHSEARRDDDRAVAVRAALERKRRNQDVTLIGSRVETRRFRAVGRLKANFETGIHLID